MIQLPVGRWHTSSQYPLLLQSYGAELEVNKKHPSPFQFKVASLLKSVIRNKLELFHQLVNILNTDSFS